MGRKRKGRCKQQAEAGPKKLQIEDRNPKTKSVEQTVTENVNDETDMRKHILAEDKSRSETDDGISSEDFLPDTEPEINSVLEYPDDIVLEQQKDLRCADETVVTAESDLCKAEKEKAERSNDVEELHGNPIMKSNEQTNSILKENDIAASTTAEANTTVENPTEELSAPGEPETLAPCGKLRSSVADAEGLALARSYRRRLRETEEYALDYMSRELHHPVVTCFRELTKSDISTLIGNTKLKKSLNSLEQSIVYLSLIDLFAAVNNNPLYGDNCNAKFSKNVAGSVQKILLEFKNIIGSWALCGNDELTRRYSLILSYLRRLVPMFQSAGFDQEFSNILDCIEKEVSRCKMNQEKLKAMGSSPNTTSENSIDHKPVPTDLSDVEPRSVLNEIVLNVSLNVKMDESDDEDITVVEEEKSSKIFGKPLKSSPKSSESSIKKIKKPKKSNEDSLNKGTRKTMEKPKKSNEDSLNKGTRKTMEKLCESPSLTKTNESPKTLASVFHSSSSPKISSNKSGLVKDNISTKTTNSAKRSAGNTLINNNETKKRKVDDCTSPVIRNEKGSIRSFFVSTSTSSESAKPTSTADSPVIGLGKPALNAFAMMMNRSRELAQKKKVDKLSSAHVPTLKLDAVKT